jgi:hypothetical protein
MEVERCVPRGTIGYASEMRCADCSVRLNASLHGDEKRKEFRCRLEMGKSRIAR